jgi:hypothetical protein
MCAYVCVCVHLWFFLFNLEFTDFYNVFSSLEFILRHSLESHWLCVFSSMRKRCTLWIPENFSRNERPFQVPQCFLQFLVFLKRSVHTRNDNNFIEYRVVSIHGVHPVCSSVVLRSKCINFLVYIKWVHWSLGCSSSPWENLCVLMKLGKQKPRITTPWFPVCYILHPHKGICTQWWEM